MRIDSTSVRLAQIEKSNPSRYTVTKQTKGDGVIHYNPTTCTWRSDPPKPGLDRDQAFALLQQLR